MSFQCTEISPSCPIEATVYGYYPNLGANSFFAVYFGVAGLSQSILGIYFRTWTFLTALGIGTFMEMTGYIGRILMHANPWSTAAFRLQIFCLILAPTFIAAGIYLTLKHIIIHVGPQYSRLNPRLFTWTFIGCDAGSIVLQAVGGGVVNSAGSDVARMDAGNDIIIAGISFQVATMAICGILAVDFIVAAWKSEPSREKNHNIESFMSVNKYSRAMWWIFGAEILAYTTVLIRCIYR
ncbi:hypothetical protein NUU61_004865 [Penicillium alfredii]|uniref:Uncharacterized protein n=1 Tax=Penicillium alfredii TaxID=1506179 RepID=A0A9W9F8P1_9EURO|nr:uncharacterized protein NUU61_004865 [Penicillium alfredii]KAJ5095509.1 hypothetical protein NUU61_004865 [Penicillium alfredii]